MDFAINPITPADVPTLLELIRELARFEHLEREVEATVESLAESFFGPQPVAGALLERVAEIAAQQRCGRFEWIALRWNLNALSFYHKLGARELDQWSMLRMDEQSIRALGQAKGAVPV